MQSTTIVIGENLVDLLVHADRVEAVIGGGPLNVARTMARLGAPVAFLSGVSGDAFGVQIAASLQADGVDLIGPTNAPLPTTMAVVTMNPAGPSYHFHLANTASFTIAAPEHLSPAALYLGTLGLLVEPMASIGEDLFLRADASTLTIVDPNCRPSATADVTGYCARLQRLYQRADVVKVSVEDLDFLAPGVTHLEGARSIIASGARLVIVTDGPGPVRCVHRDFEVEVAVAPTSIVDTVGAGDSLTGGFLAWWLGTGRTPADLDVAHHVEAALTAAIEISRRTCQQPGAQPPFAADVRDLAPWTWL